MKKKRHSASVLDYPVYLAARLFTETLGRTPCCILYPLMAILARGLYILHAPLRRKALANIRQAFGGSKSEKEMRRIARGSFVHFLWVIVDILKVPRLLTPENVHRYIQFEGFSQLETYRERGVGILFLSGHFGSFEIAGSVVGAAGYPLHTVSRPIKNPYINAWAWKSRQVLGQSKILRRGAISEVIPLLRSGENVAMLVDQNQRKNPIFVPFFGRLAATVRSPALVALRVGCPVVIGCATRIGRGFRFRTECLQTIDLPTEGTLEERVYQTMLAVNQVFEQHIAKRPEQYLWMHDRWKTRPPEEKAQAPGTAG